MQKLNHSRPVRKDTAYERWLLFRSKFFYAKIYTRRSLLTVICHILRHSFVIEYVGEVLSPAQFGRRKKQYAKDPSHSHHYFMALKTDQIIDATRKGNVSRFINHSCEPNCETQKVFLKRFLALCIFFLIGFF